MDTTNTGSFQEFGDDLQRAWDDAIKTYENLRGKGKLDDAQWDMLTRQTHPIELLESVANAPYAKAGETKLLTLAKSSIDVVIRFDNELSTLAAGTSQVSFGIPSCAWAGLRFVVHVANDIFKTPGLIVEVVAKVFVLMPRIDLYWELFHNERNALDVRPLLVDIYKTIILLNTQAISWYASSKFEKLKRTLVADPRGHFQLLLVKMTEASEEMRKRAEALNLKAQESRQRELLQEFRKRDEDQRQRIEELIDLIVQKHQGELAEQARCIKNLKAQGLIKSQNAKEDCLKSYMKFTDLRESLWNILHRAPYTILHEGFIDLGHLSEGQGGNSGRNWRTGHYSSSYPAHDGLAEISMVVDWKPYNESEKPSLRWMINVPDSLYYPGRHVGQFELEYGANFGGSYKLFHSRLRIVWESPIFSPFQSESGQLSSVGPLEETSAPLILTKTLQSIAHLLVFGPIATKSTAPFAFHSMGPQENRYFLQKDADQCMRATAFFANAFTRDLPDPDAFRDFGLLSQCRESSVKSIQELISFYGLAEKVDEKAVNDKKWQLPGAYDDANSHHEWVERDQEWAALIADLAGFGFIAKSSLKQRSTPEMIKVFEVPVAQPDSYSLSKRREMWLEKPVGTNSERAVGSVGLRNYGLPTDWTPLYIAIWRQDLSEVLLLANKQSVRVKDDVGYTPLHLACSRSSSLLFTCRQIRDREIAGFGSMAYRDKEHLFKRSDNEDAALQMCRVLLDCGADPNATTSDRYPWTPMHCVASSLWMNVANLLLEHGGSAFSARMCSPYCWALDVDTTETHRRFTAIPGKPATMEELLKAHLSQEQLDAIYAYHKRIQ